MKRIAGVSVSVALVLAFSVPALSAPVLGGSRLSTPRAMDRTRGYADAQPEERSEALSVGGAGKLSMLDSWITSNYMPDDSSTAVVWYDIENLMLVGSFYALSSRTVTASISVVNDSGVEVTSESYTAPPYPAHVNTAPFTLGVLSPGFYRVRFRIKQGASVIGQQFWIQVMPTPQQ